MNDDPLLKFIAPLAGVVLAVVLSVLVAATVAGNLDGDYQTRAWIYTGCVLWVVAGAIAVFAITHRGETKALSLSRVLLWTVSIWLWPLILLRSRRRSDADGGAPPPT